MADGAAATESCPTCERAAFLHHIDLKAGMKTMGCRACGVRWTIPFKPEAVPSESPGRRWTLSAVAERAQSNEVAERSEPDWLARLQTAARLGRRTVRPADLKRLLWERELLIAHADPATLAEIEAVERAQR